VLPAGENIGTDLSSGKCRRGLKSAICDNFRARPASRFGRGRARRTQYHRDVHLRMPSIDHGVQSFFWAFVFFLILWFGMLALGVSGATAFILSLLAGGAIFLFVRTRGEDRPGAV
jgi:hypothetical protein